MFRWLSLFAAPFLAVIAAPVNAHDSAETSAFEEAIGLAKANMMADSAVALKQARIAQSHVTGDDREHRQARITGQWLEAEALMRLNRADEAKKIITDALTLVERDFPDSKLHADLLRSRAGLHISEAEYGEALSVFLRANEIYGEIGEDRSRAIILQNIGSLYSDARDYERVLTYYRQASEAYPKDKALSLSAHNNVGNALKELDRIEEAEAEFIRALKVAEQMDSPLLEARILTNIASTQYAAGEYAKAEQTVGRGLAIAEANAPEWQPFLYGVRAQIALAQGESTLAQAYISKTFENEDLSTTSPFFRDFHLTAYEIYSQRKNYGEAIRHLEAFHRIDDQARDLSSAANNALLSARFDAANRDLEISKLSLEKVANEAQLNATEKQVILLTLGIGLVIAAFVIALLLLRMVNRSRRNVQEANEKLTHVIRHDALTQLYSRDYFHKRLERAIDESAGSDNPAILGFIDLDRFKQVNDVYGHATGDELLIQIADRFRSAAGPDVTIGRLGGDEFAIVMPAGMSIDDAEKLSERIIAEVSEPYRIGDFEIFIGASIGLTLTDTNSSTSVHMTNADLALYAAKDNGRGTCVVYDPSMRTKLEDRSSLENDLEDALENGQFSISYQPIVRPEDGSVMAYEALMRWTHPERGVVPPDEFIPVAEDARLIERLGAWMLRSACSEAVNWPENIKLSVNISTLQMADASFLQTVTQALAGSGLAPERLLLELTESMVLEMTPQLERLLLSLKELGVSLALDDFGRGYSSLNYIEKMDFSMIKIDRDFVQTAAAGSSRSQAVVSAIVALAQSLQIEVTAEGIEDQAQADAMRALGCTCFQGYFFGRPSKIIDPDHRSANKAAA